MDDTTLVREIKRRFKALRERRRRIEHDWDDICDLVAWRRSRLNEDGAVGVETRRGLRAYNSVGADSLQTWADGMFGYIVSPAHPWFRLELAEHALNGYPQVREWLDRVERHLFSLFQHTSFYSAMGQYFYDAGSIGTATLMIEDEPGADMLFRVLHPYTVYVAEDRRGRVDTVYRQVMLTARQAVQEFGSENLPERIVRDAEKDPYTEHAFIHAVFPNTERIPGRLDAAGKPWLSVYVPMGDEKIARKGGYNSNPYCVWRVSKDSREAYGRSPAMDAVCDVLMINQISRDLLRASHLAVEPPYNVPREMRGKVHIAPRAMNYYTDATRVISPVHTRIDYPIGVDREQRIEQAIRNRFRVDFFLMLNAAERQMTAYEVMERQGEKAALMASQIGRLKDDCLDPLIDRVFDLEYASGRIPEPPRIVLEYGGEIDVKYIGPLAQMQQRYQQTQSISQALQAMMPLLAAWPEAKHVIDPIKTARRLAEANGLPQDCQRDDEEIAELIAAEQQAAQAQAMAEMAPEAAAAVKQMNERVAPGSPLEALMRKVV